MKKMIALMLKDFKLLFKDKMAVFFTFIFPLIFALVFGSIFAGDGNGSRALRVAAVDQDQTEQSQQFITELSAADEFKVQLTDEVNAKTLVRKGKLVAYFILPQGFGEDYQSVFSGNAPDILVGIDPSRKAEAGYLEGSLMKLGIKRFENAFTNADALTEQLDRSIIEIEQSDEVPAEWKSLLGDYLPKMRALAQEQQDAGGSISFGGDTEANPMVPLKVTRQDELVQRSGPRNAYSITIPQGAIWAIMGCVIGFAVSLVQEKTLGTMNRLIVAPISRTQIVAGKALGCFVAQVIVVTLLFLVAYFILGVSFDISKLIIAVIASGICFVGLMMFFASLAKTERSVAGMTNAFLIMMGMIGGAMIPLFVMPGWMQAISDFSPVKWAILALEGAIWRNFSYGEMMTPVLILSAIGIVAFILGTRMVKLEDA
ncbi:ABC transporter permease [Kangiella shandongensis]|uniref:ABC transporter permease n=1 Tax=Kangiella shandongensis TaxID=2763258 RepID=UPI001CC0A118|nr:ABC transporter permease [Kangiella shandongensis]